MDARMPRCGWRQPGSELAWTNRPAAATPDPEREGQRTFSRRPERCPGVPVAERRLVCRPDERSDIRTGEYFLYTVFYVCSLGVLCR